MLSLSFNAELGVFEVWIKKNFNETTKKTLEA